MMVSQAELSWIERRGMSSADMEHVAVGGNLVDGVILAVGGAVIPKSVMSCGRYWLIFNLTAAPAPVATGLARLTGALVVCFSLSSSGCHRRFARGFAWRLAGILEMKDIGSKTKHERLESFESSVDVLVVESRCMGVVVAIGTVFARIGTVETMVADATGAETGFAIASWTRVPSVPRVRPRIRAGLK
jgi:hypothetical protein